MRLIRARNSKQLSGKIVLNRHEGDKLRLLVTDLMLPGKDGVTLALTLLSRFPRLKVILISGYTEHGLPDPASLKEAAFLPKPFSRCELIEQAVSLLDESGGGKG